MGLMIKNGFTEEKIEEKRREETKIEEEVVKGMIERENKGVKVQERLPNNSKGR